MQYMHIIQARIAAARDNIVYVINITRRYNMRYSVIIICIRYSLFPLNYNYK